MSLTHVEEEEMVVVTDLEVGLKKQRIAYKRGSSRTEYYNWVSQFYLLLSHRNIIEFVE